MARRAQPLLPAFQPLNGGIDKSVPPHAVQPSAMSHAENVVWREGRLESVAGWEVLGSTSPLNGDVMKVVQFKNVDGTQYTVILTTRDAYQLSTDAITFITQIYNTGTAACTAGTTVEGTGVTWTSNEVRSVCGAWSRADSRAAQNSFSSSLL